MGDIDDIKQRLNIVDIVSERVSLKKAGRHFKGLCPFHKEKTPSFMVSPERQSFHCFGCGKGGSVIDFVMEYEHIDFSEALEKLAERAGVTLTKFAVDSPKDRFKVKLYEVNALAAKYYEYILTNHVLGEKARMYLKKRGITDKSIATFGLGYSPNSWEGLFSFLGKKGYDGKLLEQAGLVIKGNRGWYDRFRGRVMFTLRDHRGRVVGFSGRVLDPAIKEAKYINTSETPVYVKSNVLFGLDVTKDAISKSGEAIVMEGELDVISSFQEGVGNVVAIKGSALTEGHVSLIKRFAKTIIFALDSDMAGDAASRRGIDVAESSGLDMKVVQIPDGKDPDEAVRTDPVSFKKAVKGAVPIYDYFLSSVAKRFDLSSASGKKKASEEILPLLSRISNTIVQGHYVKKTAKIFDVSEDVVTDGIKKVKTPFTSLADKEKSDEKRPITRREKYESYILSLILQENDKELLDTFFHGITLDDIATLPIRRIFEHLMKYYETHAECDIKEFSTSLPSELLAVLDEAYLWDIAELTSDKEKFMLEWKKTALELKRTILKDKLKAMTGRLTQSEENEELESEIGELSKRLSVLEKSASI